MAKDTKQGIVVAAQKLSAGTVQHFATGTQVTVAGSSFTPEQIATKLQLVVSLRTDVDAARSTLTKALAAEAAQMPSLRSFMADYETCIRGTFGATSGVLGDFGLARKSRTSSSAKTTMAAVAKRASTREARHTMGPKQKLAITGDVTGVTVITNHASVDPSSPSAPANAAGPAAASGPTTPANAAGSTAAATPHTT